jgi:hypothetical protein
MLEGFWILNGYGRDAFMRFTKMLRVFNRDAAQPKH